MLPRPASSCTLQAVLPTVKLRAGLCLYSLQWNAKQEALSCLLDSHPWSENKTRQGLGRGTDKSAGYKRDDEQGEVAQELIKTATPYYDTDD